jgi:hypothetical protein
MVRPPTPRQQKTLDRVADATRQVEGRSRFPVKPPRGPRKTGSAVYYTTADCTLAARTGTTSSNSKLTYGTVTALPCFFDPDAGTEVPDTTASVVTLLVGVIPATAPAVKANRFVRATPRGNRMLVDHVFQCT